MFNLIEKLKNVPIGTELHCDAYGKVFFYKINNGIILMKKKLPGFELIESIFEFDSQGRLIDNLSGFDMEEKSCIIFPSKDQRNWDKFEYDSIKVGTPCMVRENNRPWVLRYYTGYKQCTITQERYHTIDWKYCPSKQWDEIIPVSEFDFENLYRKTK